MLAKDGRIFGLGAKPSATTGIGSDATASTNTPTTNSATSTQSFSTLNTQTYTFGEGTWTNPYPLGAANGTGTLNGSSGTTHFIWGTTSGSYPNEVSAVNNAYVKTTWARGTTIYYKAKTINSSCAATFNGVVGANGLTTTVTFEYGTSTGVYGSSVSATPETVSANSSVTATVSSLGAGTYYFRVKAVNAAGTTYGSEQSISIVATAIVASNEKSFTPPYIGTIYEVLVVGGGGKSAMEGGGGGGVAASDSMSVGSSLSYSVGGPGTNPSGGVYTAGGSSSFGSMSATGGGGAYVYYPGRGGSSGAGSGGSTYNSTSKTGGYSGYGCEDGAGGGGGGAEGAGQDSYIVDWGPPTYHYTNHGGNGGAGKTIYGLTVSSGGGGQDIYNLDGINDDGYTPPCDYGGGGHDPYAGAAARPAQGGVVTFKYYGP